MKLLALSSVILLLYVGSYLALVEPTPDPFVRSGYSPVYYPDPLTERLSTRTLYEFDRAATFLFAPLHWVDRRLRPATWE